MPSRRRRKAALGDRATCSEVVLSEDPGAPRHAGGWTWSQPLGVCPGAALEFMDRWQSLIHGTRTAPETPIWCLGSVWEHAGFDPYSDPAVAAYKSMHNMRRTACQVGPPIRSCSCCTQFDHVGWHSAKTTPWTHRNLRPRVGDES